MQLVVNTRFLTQPMTGVQKYAWNWSLFIRQHYPDAVFVAPGNILHPEKAALLDVKKIGYTDGPVWEQTELPLWLLRNGKPLLINLGNTAPVNYSNQVITIHDLSAILHPEWFSPKFSGYYRWLLPRLATHSLHIMTVSHFSARQIQEHLNVPENKISVLYNTGTPGTEVITDRQNYVLTVGSFSKRKNYTLLLDVWEEIGDDLPYLWIRGDMEDIFGDMQDLRERISNNPKIKVIEPLNEEAMEALYLHARLLVNPSLYEGFGLPNLEAMAAGCPLLVSDLDVFREVCGDIADYAAPNDHNAWRTGLTAALQREISPETIRQSRLQADQFTENNVSGSLKTLLDKLCAM